MEKYTDNLEDIVADRTVQLEEEKVKTETLLYKMLPRWEVKKYNQTTVSGKVSAINLHLNNYALIILRKKPLWFCFYIIVALITLNAQIG